MDHYADRRGIESQLQQLSFFTGNSELTYISVVTEADDPELLWALVPIHF